MSDLAQGRLSLTVGDCKLQFPVQLVAQALLEKISGNMPPIRDSVVNPPAIGKYWQGQGGFYAGQMRCNNGGPDYHLILAEGQNSTHWCELNRQYSCALSDFDGKSNTRELIEGSGLFPAAEWARRLTVESHQDFYLPAKQEMLLLFSNMPGEFPEASYWTSTVVENQSGLESHLGISAKSACVLRVGKNGRLSMRVGNPCDLFVARAVRRVVLRSERT